MKRKDQDIEKQIDQTLDAFDGTEKAKAKPFLYTRLMARMEKRKESKATSGILSPVLQQVMIGIVILVLAFNIYTVSRFLSSPASGDTVQTEEQAFMEELYPSTPTLYTISQTTTNP